MYLTVVWEISSYSHRKSKILKFFIENETANTVDEIVIGILKKIKENIL